MNGTRASSGVGSTLGPIVRIIVSDDRPLTGKLSSVVSLTDGADATRNGGKRASVLNELRNGRRGGTDGTSGGGNVGRVVLHVEYEN